MKKQRNFGMVKIRKNQKICWVSGESKNGWSLGLAMGKRTIWLTGLRFADTRAVKMALGAGKVFVHLKGSEETT